MYTWIDVLFDLRYLSDPQAGICPDDKRPDEATVGRAAKTGWHYGFVNRMGVGEAKKFGMRGSYALNAVLHYNFKQDRFADAARQLAAMDGWWTWFGGVNAVWVMYQRVVPGVGAPKPEDTPNSEGSDVAWRHGNKYTACALNRDGHVAVITPRVPNSRQDLVFRTVDTAANFTWLPGEYTCRMRADTYKTGGFQERAAGYDQDPQSPLPQQDRAPWWYYASPRIKNQCKVLYSGGSGMNFHPFDYPENLSAVYRTSHAIWRELPNDPSQRW
jgi:hypothetical protein